MSFILALETSTELASVALLHGDSVQFRESSSVQTHSESLLPMAHALLREAGVALSDCAAIAFGAGPGSFTGVRTACGLAQGLAFGAGLPVLPVVTLLAMAEACREREGASEVLAVLDARMDEVYWAQYRYDGAWREVVEPSLAPASRVVPLGQPLACGNGLTAYEHAFAPAFHEAVPASRRHPGIMPHAVQVARIGSAMLARGEQLPARAARPLYLRNKVALTTAERLAKAGM